MAVSRRGPRIFARQAHDAPLNAAQTDGKLYRLPIDFGVTTAVGLGKVVGEYTTWTLADVNDALSKLPEGATVFNKYYTQAEMLQYCIAMNAESFMNWQDGTCSFDTDEFRALLEFVKPFPAEYDWQSDSDDYESDFTRLKNGKQLLYPTSLSGFSDLYYTFAALNNDIRFIGFPREDGSSGNAFNASCTLSISTSLQGQVRRVGLYPLDALRRLSGKYLELPHCEIGL